MFWQKFKIEGAGAVIITRQWLSCKHHKNTTAHSLNISTPATYRAVNVRSICDRSRVPKHLEEVIEGFEAVNKIWGSHNPQFLQHA